MDNDILWYSLKALFLFIVVWYLLKKNEEGED